MLKKPIWDFKIAGGKQKVGMKGFGCNGKVVLFRGVEVTTYHNYLMLSTWIKKVLGSKPQ